MFMANTFSLQETQTVHRITFAGPSSRNLSTMTSTYDLIITSPRAHCSRGSTSSVRVQRVGCSTGICNSNEGGGGDDARASGPAAPVPAALAALAAGAAAGSGGSSRGGGRVDRMINRLLLCLWAVDWNEYPDTKTRA